MITDEMVAQEDDYLDSSSPHHNDYTKLNILDIITGKDLEAVLDFDPFTHTCIPEWEGCPNKLREVCPSRSDRLQAEPSYMQTLAKLALLFTLAQCISAVTSHMRRVPSMPAHGSADRQAVIQTRNTNMVVRVLPCSALKPHGVEPKCCLACQHAWAT